MRPYLCVYGHVAIDYILSLDHFPPPNTSIDILDKERRFGGTGANLATLASGLGVPTALVSFVGDDFPQDFESLMMEHGVILDDLVKVNGYQTPTIWVVTDSDQNQMAFVYQGSMRDMERFDLRLDKALESDVIHIYTGRPGYYLQIISRIGGRGKRISLDPAQEIHHIWTAEQFKKALPMSDIFFANSGELRTALRYLDLEDPHQMLEYVPMIINTKGAAGSVLYSREGKVSVSAIPPRRMIDPTGAGDAFRAGFYAALYRGMELKGAMIIASSAASFSLEGKGGLSVIPTWDEVLERAKSHPQWC